MKMVACKQRPQTAAPSRLVNLSEKIGKSQASLPQKEYHGLERTMSQNKVLEVRKLHGNLIGLPTVEAERIKREQEATERLAATESLSIYAAQKQFKNPVRPFSAALERENLAKVRKDTIKVRGSVAMWRRKSTT